MPIPKVYAKQGVNTISSYNYTDIAEGTGIVIHYGFNHTETTTTNHALTKETLRSRTCYTGYVTSETDFTLKGTINFDATYNMPQRIKGKARAIFCLGAGSSAATSNADIYAVFTLKKSSAGIVTTIATATSPTLVSGADDVFYSINNMEIDIPNIIHFKKGDILRVAVEIWGKKTATTTTMIYFFHDPADRVTASLMPEPASTAPTTTQFAMHIPYVLNL